MRRGRAVVRVSRPHRRLRRPVGRARTTWNTPWKSYPAQRNTQVCWYRRRSRAAVIDDLGKLFLLHDHREPLATLVNPARKALRIERLWLDAPFDDRENLVVQVAVVPPRALGQPRVKLSRNVLQRDTHSCSMVPVRKPSKWSAGGTGQDWRIAVRFCACARRYAFLYSLARSVWLNERDMQHPREKG